jgi:hypothetical protein
MEGVKSSHRISQVSSAPVQVLPRRGLGKIHHIMDGEYKQRDMFLSFLSHLFNETEIGPNTYLQVGKVRGK